MPLGLRLVKFSLFALAGSLAANCALAKVESVQSLRQGVVLFDYYQQHYLAALSELKVAKIKDAEHTSSAQQLMEGSIGLSYGLAQRSGDLFDSVLAQDQTPLTKATAWLYMARLHHNQGDFEAAAKKLALVTEMQAKRRQTELLAVQRQARELAVEIASRVGDLETAARQLPLLQGLTLEWAYAQFNVASAYARAGDCENATVYYRGLTDLVPVASLFTQREFLALYDKALVNSGYCYLRTRRAAAALTAFQRVRLNGDFAPAALMGYGWAAWQRQAYEQALAPWHALIEDTTAFGYRQEALLGAARIYEQLGRQAAAIEAFSRAERDYQRATSDLDDIRQRIKQEPIADVLNLDPASSLGSSWLTVRDAADVSDELISPWLLEVYASAGFQLLRQDLEALAGMRQSLKGWQQRLAIWQELMAERKRQRDVRVSAIAVEDFRAQLAKTKDTTQQHQAWLDKVTTEHDYLAIADNEVKLLNKRLQRARKNWQALQTQQRSNAAQLEQIERFRGLLLWQATQQYSSQLRQQQKQLLVLQQATDTYQKSLQRLEAAIVSQPDISPYLVRIDALSTRLQQMNNTIAGTAQQLEKQLKRQLLVQLDEYDQRLDQYLLVARLSKARLYDDSAEASQ